MTRIEISELERRKLADAAMEINRSNEMNNAGAGNVQQQILDALTILTTPTMMVEDPNKLRDQFAMAALPALIAANPTPMVWEHASNAYEIADAMMEERAKK